MFCNAMTVLRARSRGEKTVFKDGFDGITAFLGRDPSSEAGNPNRALQANNQAVYSLLRHGAMVKRGTGEQTEPLPLVDWKNPDANDFSAAEEVTLRGGHG